MNPKEHGFDYIPRTLAGTLRHSLEQYPVVTVLGPRQSGKTTFVRTECPDFAYVNLEDPEWRDLARNDPKTLFSRYPGPLILDEIQRVPELLSYIQVLSDAEGAEGRFILTGSHQASLQEAIAQSLAGRTAVLTLLPLSLAELGDRCAGDSRETILHRGFLPRIHARGQEPTGAYRSYFQTYVERDLRFLLLVKDLSKFEMFLRLLAGRAGRLFVASSIAGEIGVSYKTVQDWVSVLEASYIVFRLQPYHSSYGKRLVKTPKLYFTEPGLAVYLLGIETPDQLGRDPLFGSLFENMVVSEAVKARLHRGRDPNVYFFRDSNGNEVDLLLDRRPAPCPVEIKSSRTLHKDLFKGLRTFHGLNPDSPPGWVIYSGDLESSGDGPGFLNFRHTERIFAD